MKAQGKEKAPHGAGLSVETVGCPASAPPFSEAQMQWLRVHMGQLRREAVQDALEVVRHAGRRHPLL